MSKWKVVPRDETPGFREPAMVDTGEGRWEPFGVKNPEEQAALIVDAVNSRKDELHLRDVFACAALAGMLAAGGREYNLSDSDGNAQYAAFRAYTMADFMLCARETEASLRKASEPTP